MSYTNQQIQDYAYGQGWAAPGGQVSNPWAIYANAQKFGVGANQLDSALGLGAGTSANWVNQQGLSPLGEQQPLQQVHFPGQAAAPSGWPGGLRFPGQPDPPGFQSGFAGDTGPVGQPSQGYSVPVAGGGQLTYGSPPPGWGGQGGAAPAAPPAPPANPYMSGTNPYAGPNPYLQQNIDATAADVTRGFQNNVLPALDAQARASGSFGNTAVDQQRQEAYRNLNTTLGNLSNAARFQDYGTQQQLGENALNRAQQNSQFGQNLDFNSWQANNALMRQGQQDQLSFINQLLGWNNAGLSAATQQQNTPLSYWQQFLNGATQAGGLGGTNAQNLQGNPWLGALGGYLFGSKLVGG